ncbi:endo-1,4-beta-xylanase [Candidatus Nanopelagicales bacterium]|nr:endo-1,4-beta-xylanase [Candidatus Nanopelagicales bacterium]
MRRALTAAIASAALLGSTIAVAPMASAANPVPDVAFGMHVPQIANGEKPNANIGTVRLWDAGVAWGQVQQKKNTFWWNGMDAAIASANAQGMSITYVLGSTPKWAQKKAPKGKYPYGGTGAANPKMSDWKKWVKAVVQRYGNSIDAYQIWNEANLADFYDGTPKQMAALTKEAYKIIRAYDPTAKVVAASSTVRLTKSYNRFFPAYLKELKKQKWPVDAIAVHTYPPGKDTPADRLALLDKVNKDIKKGKVPTRIELWDTEVNYGIKGPGKVKGQTITGGQAADWTASTFLDSILTGVDRTYWYYWYRPDGRLGIILDNTPQGDAGRLGYQTAYDWMVNSFYSCTRGGPGQPNVCQLGDDTNPEVVVWSNEGVGTYTVPANATVQCNTLNQCSAIAPGTPLPIGGSPLWFGSQANYDQLLAQQQENAAARAAVQAQP